MIDIYKNIDYWNMKISEIENQITKNIEKYNKNELNKLSIYNIHHKFVNLMKCYYSAGLVCNYSDLFCNALHYFIIGSDDTYIFKDRDGNPLKHYTLSGYDDILTLLSIGIILDFDIKELSKISTVVDRYYVKDKILEYIFHSFEQSRDLNYLETYTKYHFIEEKFAKIREAIDSQNVDEKILLIRNYIVQDWYRNHKSTGWYNSHNHPSNIYTGYYCFEAAAFTKLLSINDSSFSDHKYYPKYFGKNV